MKLAYPEAVQHGTVGKSYLTADRWPEQGHPADHLLALDPPDTGSPSRLPTGLRSLCFVRPSSVTTFIHKNTAQMQDGAGASPGPLHAPLSRPLAIAPEIRSAWPVPPPAESEGRRVPFTPGPPGHDPVLLLSPLPHCPLLVPQPPCREEPWDPLFRASTAACVPQARAREVHPGGPGAAGFLPSKPSSLRQRPVGPREPPRTALWASSQKPTSPGRSLLGFLAGRLRLLLRQVLAGLLVFLMQQQELPCQCSFHHMPSAPLPVSCVPGAQASS